MKKLSIVLLVIMGLPGCLNYFKSGSKLDNQSVNIPLRGDKKQQKNAEEDVNEFELIDDLQDESGNNRIAQNVERVDDFDWDDVSDQQLGAKTVYFDYDKSGVRADQETAVVDNASYANDIVDKGEVLVVEGHADMCGKNRVYNLALSEKRAQTVAKKLIEKGVPKERVKVVGRGQEMPAVIAAVAPDEQAPNRRVEVYGIAA